MSDTLEQGLAALGLEQYVPRVRSAGFSTWASLSSITEAELALLDFRLGDRRKLQRAFARLGTEWPDTAPLPTATQLRQHLESHFSSKPTLDETSYSYSTTTRLRTWAQEVESEQTSKPVKA